MAAIRWLAMIGAVGIGLATQATAQETLCDNPQEQCSSLLAPECVGRVGAAATAAPEGGACEAQLSVYRNCLALVARNCEPVAAATNSEAGGQRVRAVDAVRQSKQFEIALQGCAREPGVVRCVFMVSNLTPGPLTGYFFLSRSRVTLPNGVPVKPLEASIGEQSGRARIDYLFASDVPTRLEVLIEDVAEEMSEYAAVELYENSDKLISFVWRGVAIE